MRFDNMVLYAKMTCPFCIKVMNFMKDNDIEMEIKDSLQEENREKLIELNGTTQVPCLVVDGKPMLESSDIIAFLSDQLA